MACTRFLPAASMLPPPSPLGPWAALANLIPPPRSRASSPWMPGTLGRLLFDLGLDLFPGLQLLVSEYLLERGCHRDLKQGLFLHSLSQGRGCSLDGLGIFIHDGLSQGLMRLFNSLVGCLHGLLVAHKDLPGQVLLFFCQIELAQYTPDAPGTRPVGTAPLLSELPARSAHLHRTLPGALRLALLTVGADLPLTTTLAWSALSQELPNHKHTYQNCHCDLLAA